MTRIAVIGGGLAGLSASRALQQRGIHTVLFEAGSRLGGRALTDELDGLRIDPCAQLFGSMYENFLALVRDVGLGEQLVRVPGRDALWRDGRAHEVVYGSVASMATSGGLPLFTRLRLGGMYAPFLARHAHDLSISAPEKAAVAGLDNESIAAWGEREIDEAFVSALVYPQLGAYYAASPDDTSAGFYHILARYGMDVTLYAVNGGVGSVAERIGSRILEAGGELRLSSPVREVTLTDGTPHQPGPVAIRTDAGEETFDGVIAALPAPLLPPMLRGAPEGLQRWLAEVRYHPAVALVLTLDTPTSGRFFGLSFPRGTTRYVSAVAVQEHKGIPLSDRNRGALVVFSTPEVAGTLVGMESREVLDLMLPEVASAFPGIEKRVTRARVYRWPEGAPVMYPGYLARVGGFRKDSPEGDSSIVLAGDYLYGPSVEGAVLSGLAAADRLTSRLRIHG
ncbi:MAG: FAD-dependent oxidoreductase [Gemmatimonadota bacterium]|nr:FAD-dependent oxidoreductase [Gemmatimonadota bacterium]